MRFPRHWRGPDTGPGNRWSRCDSFMVVRLGGFLSWHVYGSFGGYLNKFTTLENAIKWVDQEFPIQAYSTPRAVRTPQVCQCTQNQLFLADIDQALSEEEENGGP